MWDELKDVDLWGGKGCGGSQKCEIAYLNKKKKKEMLDKGEDEKPWEYDCIDVAHFLKEEFKVGTHVDAFDGKVWWKGTLLAVPRAIPKDPQRILTTCGWFGHRLGRFFPPIVYGMLI